MLGQGMAGAGAWMGQTTSLCLFLHFCGIRVLSVLRGGGPAMHVQLYSHTGTGKLETHSPPRSCTSRKGSYSVGLLGDFNQEMHLCLLLWLAPPGPGAPRGGQQPRRLQIGISGGKKNRSRDPRTYLEVLMFADCIFPTPLHQRPGWAMLQSSMGQQTAALASKLPKKWVCET